MVEQVDGERYHNLEPMEAEPKFNTERTARHRSKVDDASDTGIIDGIEEYGCQVIQIHGTSTSPGWYYTIGVYDNCGEPEILTVGLREHGSLPTQ